MLTAANNATPGERSLRLGDHGRLTLSPSVVAEDDDPIVGFAELVSPGGVREQRGVVPVAAMGM